MPFISTIGDVHESGRPLHLMDVRGHLALVCDGKVYLIRDIGGVLEYGVLDQTAPTIEWRRTAPGLPLSAIRPLCPAWVDVDTLPRAQVDA